MSLINDALRRAREADRQTTPPPSGGPQLRPLEPAPQTRRRMDLALPLAMTGLALLALFLVWQVAQHRGQPEAASRPEPRSTPILSSPLAIAADDARNLSTTESDARNLHAQQPPADDEDSSRRLLHTNEVALVSSSRPVPETPSGTPAVSAVPAVQEPASTNVPAVVEPPKPPALKLQSVIFSATRPSVMINGRTLFIGERIGEFRVTAIGRESATLTGSDQTKVLNLSE